MPKLQNIFYGNENIKALILCLSDPVKSPRPLRAIKLLRSLGFHVSILGSPASSSLDADVIYKIDPPSLSARGKIIRKVLAVLSIILPCETIEAYIDSFKYGFNRAIKELTEESFDLILVEDLYLLPAAYKLKNGAKVVFDAREYYPRQYENRPWFNLIEKPRVMKICKNYLHRCDLVLTVSEGLRNEYNREFGIFPVVYRSVPYYQDLPVKSVDLNKIKMVYHGLAHQNRQLETMIQIFALLDERFYLDLILVGNPGYQKQLKHQARGFEKIKFLEPVPFEKIISTISNYDIGFFYYKPLTFNIKHCLPNKFFEYIQARLMLAIGPSPDMADLVKHYDCGVVAEEFTIEAMAEVLNKLDSEAVDYYKNQSSEAAEDLCFEKESKIFIAEINRLIS